MIISFLNEKGGVGKSTLTANIAAYISEVLFKKVLIVDTDKQGSLRDWHTVYSQNKQEANLSSYMDLISLDTAASIKSLPSLSANYDFVLVDGAGKAGLEKISIQAIKVSDMVLIPVQPSCLDFWGSESVFSAAQARRELTGNPLIYFLLNRVNSRTDIFKQTRKDMAEEGYPCLNGYISQRVSFSAQVSEGNSVVGSSDLNAYKEIVAVVNELLRLTEATRNVPQKLEEVA